VLSTITTLAIGALAFARVMGLSDAGPITDALALSATIQLALPAPLFIAIVRRRSRRVAAHRAERLAAPPAP
jgi:hypothetical protein